MRGFRNLHARARRRRAAAALVVLSAVATGAAAGTVGATFGAFSGTTSNTGNTFSAAASFGGCRAASASGMFFINGFESGRIYAGNGGTTFATANAANTTNTTADTSVVRHGTYSLKVVANGQATNASWLLNVVTNTLVIRFGVRLAALPSADVELARVGPGTGSVLQLMYHTSTQKLALQWSGNTSVESSTTVAAGQWYLIDLKIDMSAATWSGAWYVNNVAQTGRTISGTAGTNVYNLWLGTRSADTYTAYYDDFAASTASADYPLGDGKVLALRPTANGTHNIPGDFQNDDSTAINSSSYTRLNETPALNSTQYVKQVTAASTAYLEFAFGGATDTCIRAVAGLEMYNPNTGTKTNSAKASVFNGTTETVVYSGNMVSSSATEFVQSKIVPPSGATWTLTELNNLVMRIGYASSITNIPRWDALAIQYEVPL